MYNVDHRSKEFNAGLQYFLGVAEANKQDGFMCYPCAVCKNLKEYSCLRTLHTHLLKSGFVLNYICCTKRGERGVLMDDGEEAEVELDHADILLSTVPSVMMQRGEMMKRMRQRQKMWQLMVLLLVIPFAMHKEIVKVRKRRPSSSVC